MSSLKAEIAKVKIGNLSFEGLMDEDGKFYIAITQLVSLGLIPAGRSLKQLVSFLGLDSSDFIKLQSNLCSKDINAISLPQVEKLLVSLANNGNSHAQSLLDKAGVRYITPNKRNTRNQNNRDIEKVIQLRLSAELGGIIEVKTLAGRVDILTSTQIIEVKNVSAWKSALGQILVYGDYYPSHTKRLHLFGETQESYLAMITNHCFKRDIIVTWESS